MFSPSSSLFISLFIYLFIYLFIALDWLQFPARPTASSAKLNTMTRREKQFMVFNELREVASVSQDKLRAQLEKRGFEVKTFWLGNTMQIKAATPALIRELRSSRTAVEIEAVKIVAHIHEPMVHEIFETLPKSSAKLSTHNKRAVEWNIEIIQAEAAWAISTGFNITVANIDTGVRYTHEALIDSYKGNNGDGTFNHDYNWHDPRGTQAQPFDNNGHGTHTMGSIVGSELVAGIGVAPAAKWIAAKGCASSSCSNADLISSFEYLFAPTKQDGTDPDPAYAPQIISNSWGGGQGSTTFLDYISPHVEVGTVVTFSQGNAGPGCGSANSPGDLTIVIGVGSTDSGDALSSFSSRGPSIISNADFNIQKPDISAPGSSILSSYYSSDTSYASLSGTSMACPHVSGLIALLYEVNPNLSVDQVKSILQTTSFQGVAPPTGLTTCSGIPYTQWPNYHYGYGRIDAFAAVRAAGALAKKL